MKNMTKMILVLVAGLMLAQCSTYKIKPDMNKAGVVNKTPKWYVDYNHETMFKYQEAATAVSPDMELAVKKATLLAKAKLVDRINGEMNNRTTITKDEAGTNDAPSLHTTFSSVKFLITVPSWSIILILVTSTSQYWLLHGPPAFAVVEKMIMPKVRNARAMM